MRRSRLLGLVAVNAAAVAVVAVVLSAVIGRAGAQTAAPPTLTVPRVLAVGLPIPVKGTGGPPGGSVVLERRRSGKWAEVRSAPVDDQGGFQFRHLPRPARTTVTLRVRAGEAVSAERTVRFRPVTLDAVGDINLGDRTADLIRSAGPRAPWSSVGRTLRRADVAFGNLECAISLRGVPQVKEFLFRGSPRALRGARDAAGLDVLNLANNHAGDFGKAALLDTIASVRRLGMLPVGAGGTLAGAARPQVIERLGLRIAFVGFSDINPAGFPAGPSSPGLQTASVASITRGVKAARQVADVVVATFHWGVERSTTPNERQRGFALAAVRAGARVVIGAHPHVLQPVQRARRTVVAYSLGNFVFAAASPGTTSTGILELRLSADGVVGSRLRRARIEGVRPVLGG